MVPEDEFLEVPSFALHGPWLNRTVYCPLGHKWARAGGMFISDCSVQEEPELRVRKAKGNCAPLQATFSLALFLLVCFLHIYLINYYLIFRFIIIPDSSNP